MKIVKFFLLVIILFLSRNLLPQIRITPPAPERERTYDLLHVKINLSFDWNEKAKVRELISAQEYDYIFGELQKLPKSINHLIKYTNEKLLV